MLIRSTQETTLRKRIRQALHQRHLGRRNEWCISLPLSKITRCRVPVLRIPGSCSRYSPSRLELWWMDTLAVKRLGCCQFAISVISSSAHRPPDSSSPSCSLISTVWSQRFNHCKCDQRTDLHPPTVLPGSPFSALIRLRLRKILPTILYTCHPRGVLEEIRKWLSSGMNARSKFSHCSHFANTILLSSTINFPGLPDSLLEF